MKNRLWIILAVLALGAGIWYLIARNSDSAGKSGKAGGPAVAGSNDKSASGSGASAGEDAKSGKAKARPKVAGLSIEAQKVYDAIADAMDELRSGDPARRKAALEKLDELLSGEGHNAAANIAAIVAFLKTGQDSPTGEEFSVGENGVLATSNTLRVLLMDQFGTLCLEAKSTEALTVAQEVMRKFGSPDEWAVSLRNMAWLDPNSAATLNAKMAEMLTHKEWLESPSRGYLEAFDVAVHTGGADLITDLQGFLKLPDENPLWRASSVALDRMAQEHPGEILAHLNANPSLLQDNPGQRADLFSKADIANNDQRSLIEAYLNRGDVGIEEKTKLLESLVTPGGFLSNNLLTKQPTAPTAESEAARLALLHRQGEEWVKSNKFPTLTEQLGQFVNNTKPAPAEQQ